LAQPRSVGTEPLSKILFVSLGNPSFIEGSVFQTGFPNIRMLNPTSNVNEQLRLCNLT
jgi:hypothetical protein